MNTEHKVKCECDLPYIEHKPNECLETRYLKQYIRDGRKIWLCSNCCLSSDKEVSEE